MVAHIAKRLLKSFADFSQLQSFEIEQLKGSPLDLRQILECALQVGEVNSSPDFAFHIRFSY